MKKDTRIYMFLAVIVLIIIYIILSVKGNQETPEEKLARCIGENSIVYVKLGCGACASQEAMFGDNSQYINKIDCYYDIQSCINANITGTPTWVINGEKYLGVQTIERLKELTGC